MHWPEEDFISLAMLSFLASLWSLTWILTIIALQEIPEALTQAIACLQNLTDQPRIRMQKRRGIMDSVFHGKTPKPVPVHDVEKQAREREEKT